MIMDVRSFAFHWVELSGKQQECLLRTLEVFLLPLQKKGPNIVASKNVTNIYRANAGRLSKKQQKKSIPSTKPALVGKHPTHFASGFSTGNPTYRHSPEKIGIDGVSKYGRSVLPRQTLKILMERERAERNLKHI
jgi:hypothetical protein